MGCDSGRAPQGGVYRPRKPRASALYQCAERHAADLRTEGRYQRLFEERVIERFLQCGDPHHGFARTEERAAVDENAHPETAVRARSSWARLIHKVYEVDPLRCPKCQGPMRVIALIDDEAVIRRILEHLGLCVPRGLVQSARPPPARQQVADVLTPAPNAWTYHPVPDIA